MKRCRNTKLIFISLVLLLSTLLFRNIVEPFDDTMTATQAAQRLGEAAIVARETYDTAKNVAGQKEAAYTAALGRFTANPTQENGIALSNAQTMKDAAKKAEDAALIAAETAKDAAASAAESIPVSAPPPPQISAELQSAALSATILTETSDTTKIIIAVASGIAILYIIYLVIFSKKTSNSNNS
jgi:hypothetical protein